MPLDEFELRIGVLSRIRQLPECIKEHMHLSLQHTMVSVIPFTNCVTCFPDMLETLKYVSACKACLKKKGIDRCAPLKQAAHPMEGVNADLVDLYRSFVVFART